VFGDASVPSTQCGIEEDPDLLAVHEMTVHIVWGQRKVEKEKEKSVPTRERETFHVKRSGARRLPRGNDYRFT
jgi:hypothetical protein